MEKKYCETCGGSFTPSQWQKTKRFCSGPCTNGWYNKTNSKYRKKKK
jgi:hypothetical protein